MRDRAISDQGGRLRALAALGVAALVAVAMGWGVGGGGVPMIAVLGVIAVIGAAVLAQTPLLGVIGITVAIFANLADVLIVYFGFPSINKLLAPGLLFLLSYRYLINGDQPLVDGTFLAMTVTLLTVYLVSATYAFSHTVAMEELNEALRNMIIVVLALACFRIRGAFDAFVATLVTIGFVVGAVGLFKHTIGDPDSHYWGLARAANDGPRLSGFMADPNDFGAILVALLPFALNRALWSERAAARLYALCAAALICIAIILTQSRGALLAGLAGVMIYSIAMDRRTIIRLALCGAVVGFAATVVLSDQIAARFSTILDMAATGVAMDRAVEGRLGSWAVAIRLFLDNPLQGVGAGNFSVKYQDTANDLGVIFRSRDRSPHSLYLEVLSEFGAIGLALLLGAVAVAIRRVIRAASQMQAQGDMRLRASCIAVGAALTAHLLAQGFLQGPAKRQLWLLLGVAVALPAIMALERDRRARAAVPDQAHPAT